MLDLSADLLADLDPAQREAVLATTGPVCILAGAGTGKTRAISRRVGYAVETGAVAAQHVLVVTFTDKAAGEMRERLTALGRPGIVAATFHSAALRQLRHFWPRVSGTELPAIMASKVALVVDLARSLPGGYRFVAVRDLAAEIEWAKARRIRPEAYERTVESDGHDGPLPGRLFAPLYRRYEAAKERAGRIDFEDMLELTVRLIEDDESVAREVRDRYRWFSVDEYQDTNTLQQALLDAWLGGRDDLAVVGDADQTIYTFTGASSEWLTGFTRRYPAARVVRLETNYRSSPQVLELANRLLARSQRVVEGPPKRLVATRPAGPLPVVRQFATGEEEERAIAGEARRLIVEGVPAEAMAVLVRTNGQLVGFEAAFRAAGVPFQLRGERFFNRPEIRRALAAVRGDRHPPPIAEGETTSLTTQLAGTWARALDFQPDEVPAGEEARQRHGALLALLEIGRELEVADPEAGTEAFLAEVGRRTAAEAEGTTGSGVELLTYHRAKGLEWDAVFLPALEEGILPIRQANEPAEVEEERRLLYVGITRARVHLWLSSARRRDGRSTDRRRSRFLLEVLPSPTRSTGVAVGPGRPDRDARAATGSAVGAAGGATDGPVDGPLFEALRAWRLERARADAVPPYVIFHDSTLTTIAARRPRDLADLAGIPGIGPTKLDRYGEELVSIVAADRP
ncbi:MAG TPA: ATP-dependent DNA helicase UvrD2 [Patescibacteria group bacterium]|nr:ATP-dependent DNA helicase UvrD2 [Patescibacteria group bacterium]